MHGAPMGLCYPPAFETTDEADAWCVRCRPLKLEGMVNDATDAAIALGLQTRFTARSMNTLGASFSADSFDLMLKMMKNVVDL
jgi:hypothetical protein